MRLMNLGMVLFVVGAFVACAESGQVNSTASASSTTTSGGGSTSTSATTSTSTTSTSTSTSSGQGGGTSGTTVVVNEISAKGEDWVELYNPTSADVDISDFGLCDDDAMGACDMASILRFPMGTKLPKGQFLLVVGNEPADAGTGPSTSCLAMGGPATCFHVGWKVSSSKGETVHLIDAKDALVDELKYPMDAAPAGQTWGRLPDGTGPGALNQPTPAAPNKAP
jgi:hypothetical protein